MKYLYLILFVLMFCGCDKEQYLGDLDSHEQIPMYKPTGTNQAYIYEERLADLNHVKCHIIGTINGYEVNRFCYVQHGYINIGSLDKFPEFECYMKVSVILNNHVICYIKENKKIFHN